MDDQGIGLAREALKHIQLFWCLDDTDIEVRRLGGLTNLVFFVSLNGEQYVLRIPGKGTEEYINRKNEAHAAREAAKAGVSPDVVHFDDKTGVMVTRVVDHVEAFARVNNTADTQFLLAAGSAGIEAATNIVVKDAWRTMLLMVYGAVVLLCFITFRSWRAVVVAVLPLVVTSFLAEALMVALGMGVKVATLPVIALGVGIGVDYALYILSITLSQLREGKSLSEAYYRALLFTGKVVMLTGVTLAVGVITWVASPIKFQADMGLLLAFMFLWNMLGALVLLPALAHFLLKPAAPVANARATARDVHGVPQGAH